MKLKKEPKEIDFVIKSKTWSEKNLADFSALMQEIKQQNRKNSTKKSKTKRRKIKLMEKVVNLHIEKLPEGFYLATSDSIQGLIAQGRTVSETLEIARDVVKKFIEAQEEEIQNLPALSDSFDYQIIVGV